MSQAALAARCRQGVGVMPCSVPWLCSTGGSATAAPVPAGTRVPLVPRNAATWWNKVDLSGGWALGLGLIHQAESYASTTNTVILPAFTRADAAVYCSFGKQNRLSLNVENLFDRRYYPNAGNDYNITVGTPRRVQLTLSGRF